MSEPDRQPVVAALQGCSPRMFALILSAASGLLQTEAMKEPGEDLPLLDAVLAYLRRQE